MAKARGNEQAWLGGARNPSTFDWIVAIFVVAVQIGLVMAVNALFIEPDPTRMKNVDRDPVNTVCIAASLASIVIASSFVYRDIAQLLARNTRCSYLCYVCCDLGGVVNPS